MFDSILVPLDGSLLAEGVLPHVVALGQAFNAKIFLVQVLDQNEAGASAQLFDLVTWQINKTEAQLYLDGIADRLQKSGLATKAIVLEGPVAESITDFAQSQELKLIILSSHGHHGVRKWGISSVTHKLILSAPTSVLIVRAQANLNEQPYRRILVALDGSWRAENVLPLVTQLARFHQSQIQIVQAVKTLEMARQLPAIQEDIDLANRIVERNRTAASRYLEQVRSSSPLTSIPVQTQLLTTADTPAALHRLVAQENIDLVVLSAHGQSGNNQWPYGGLVNNFILYGQVPLLVVQDLPVKEQTSRVEMTVREYSEQ